MIHSPMHTIVRGRLIEIWSDSSEDFIELAVGTDRWVFKASGETSDKTTENPAGALGPFQRGDLLEVCTSESREVQSVKKLGGPIHGNWSPLADGMRWRRPAPDRAVQSPSLQDLRMFRLWQRQTIIREIREDFFSQNFLEVETPLLVKSTCPDIHMDSIVASVGHAGGSCAYLVTSTEYQIKRLMVGGFEQVYTLTKNFRANDQGRYHSHEFTMLEWARAYGSLAEIEDDAIRLIRKAFQKLYPGQTSLDYNGVRINFLEGSWEKLSVREAFRIHLGLIDVKDFSLEALLQASGQAGIELPSHFKEDNHLVLSFLLDQLQFHLGRKTPTFLREWPAFMTSSARIHPLDPQFAERSELYIAGIEISDGFPFLCDAEAQRTYFARELKRRQEEGRSIVIIDELYLQALDEGIPPGAGMALGIDRLVMVLTGAQALAEVQAFAWNEV